MAEGPLRGKNALVTGGAKRIGRAIAHALADEGANVVIHYSGSEVEAFRVRDELKAKGAGAWTIKADFESHEEYSTLIDRARGASGPLDILVNNASIFPKDTLDDIAFHEFVLNMQVNAWVPFALSRDFARAEGRGKIVNLIDARISGFDWTHVNYILSKHVLHAFTRMLAVKYAPDITVNGVNPGLILPPPGKEESYIDRLVHTVPLKRHGGPEDIAAAVVFILKSDFMTGTVIDIDGGRHLMEHIDGPHPDK